MGLAVGCPDADFVAVRNLKQLPILRRDEPDALRRILEVAVEGLLDIAVGIQVIHAGGGVEPQQVGVLLRVYPDAVVTAVGTVAALRMLVAVRPQFAPRGQDAAVGRIGPQGVDCMVQLGLELRRVAGLIVINPRGTELLSAAEVSPQVADAPGLSDKLPALCVSVFVLCGGHRSDSQIHGENTS